MEQVEVVAMGLLLEAITTVVAVLVGAVLVTADRVVQEMLEIAGMAESTIAVTADLVVVQDLAISEATTVMVLVAVVDILVVVVPIMMLGMAAVVAHTILEAVK